MKTLITATALSLSLFATTAIAGATEAFLPTDFDGVSDDSGVLLTLEYGGKKTPDISFGWYFTDTGDNTVVSTMNIFDGQDTVGSASTVNWDFGAQTATSSNGGDVLSWAGIESDWELGASFSYQGDTIYSHDALNGGLDLIDIDVIDWAGFDLAFSFNDTMGKKYKGKEFGQIVKVSDVTPWNNSIDVFDVPTPASFALFGLAIAGFGFAKRKNLLS